MAKNPPNMDPSVIKINTSLPRLEGLKRDRGTIQDGQRGIQFSNWAQTFTCKPELFFMPESVEEIKAVRHLSQQLE